MKISEKSNGRIIEKWLKFPSNHSNQRNISLNFTPAFFHRFKDLEPMLRMLLPIEGKKKVFDQVSLLHNNFDSK